MRKIHKTQEKLLDLLKSTIDHPLTIRELASSIGEQSPGVIHHHLVQLEKKGYLKRNPNNPKDYTILDSGEKLIVYLNKYGTAQCGPNGIMLDDNVIEKIPIASSLLKFPSSEAFIVEARGDSMEPKIFSGDIVIGRKQEYAEHNDFIICTYNEEVMIKQLKKGNDGLILYSINSGKYNPKKIEAEDLKIAGIVKNILHYD
ncbi:LexA repressor [Flavobacterium noncentrifugens]|uniref:Repressor LexA n=1 Tax=Flavobacterium noncentrifugens TaxID=1128970 RepID=A0A1G9CTU3_9FLAO|nr:S24 family peptidase [Flavobacterium noncentrifugens]GEP52150.1 LexA repressor [Flavobacterium noncentrifugens]SDK55037.1 repressor LexA [Flavobacterium noncentrifugens]